MGPSPLITTSSCGPSPQICLSPAASAFIGDVHCDRALAPTSTADSLSLRRQVQWLNTMFRTKTTITVEVMLDPKLTSSPGLKARDSSHYAD